MYTILKKEKLTNNVVLMEIEAPFVAGKCQPGQFVILRVNEQGERIPLTVAGFDRIKGSVTIIYQVVGKTTQLLSEKNEGDSLLDFVGPLGTASHTTGFSKVAVIGGGLGCAIAYPQAKAIFENGAHMDIIAGFRSKEFVILEEEMKAASNRFFLMSDDGSAGEKGLVTNKLEELIKQGNQYDAVIAIGPIVMMKFVALLTKKYDIKTIVSMNPVMIDGTGMCGGCRLSVGGKTKFACVDGPDFDGHLVDFDEAIRRSKMYAGQERQSMESHVCKMDGMVEKN